MEKNFDICRNFDMRSDSANDGKSGFRRVRGSGDCNIEGCTRRGRCVIARDNSYIQIKSKIINS